MLKKEGFLCYSSIIPYLALAVKAFFLQIGSVRSEIFCEADVADLLCGFDVQLLRGLQRFACARAADRLAGVDDLIKGFAREGRVSGNELVDKRFVTEQMLCRITAVIGLLSFLFAFPVFLFYTVN